MKNMLIFIMVKEILIIINPQKFIILHQSSNNVKLHQYNLLKKNPLFYFLKINNSIKVKLWIQLISSIKNNSIIHIYP